MLPHHPPALLLRSVQGCHGRLEQLLPAVISQEVHHGLVDLQEPPVVGGNEDPCNGILHEGTDPLVGYSSLPFRLGPGFPRLVEALGYQGDLVGT
jgi:hypothetical protein